MTTPEICNAKIESTSLGREDHGIFTFGLTVRMSGGGCTIGGYALDNWNETLKRRVCGEAGLQLIDEILRVVGVKRWEDLKGRYIRVINRGWGSTINEIGNLIDDKWLNFEDFFKARGAC